MICPKCGSASAKRNGNNRGWCGEGRHSFLIRPDSGALQPVPDGYVANGTSTLYRPDGSIAAQWVKTSIDAERQREILTAAVDAMAADLPRVAPRKAKGAWRDDLLVVYPIGDGHVGMYAWGQESGDDWDLSIADRVHCDAISALVQSAPETETALIVNLGDLLHYDSLAAVTPRSGHLLDADGRYAKMVETGVKIMRQCIESALTKHKRVHVISAPGNHDETGALWLSRLLAVAYEREPRVTVETTPSLFAYHRFGKVLLGVHHGHTAKPDKLPGVMACDRAKDWGETQHRAWLCGHVHHASRREYAGVTVESFGTLAAKDAYAANGGWRSDRAMTAIVYHRVHGEVARSRVTPAMFADRD